jgi:hypothetical protein
MSSDLAKRIEVLEKHLSCLLKDKPLTEYECFCFDEKNHALAWQKVIDDADEDVLPTEDLVKKELAKMWQSKQDDKKFFEENFRSMKNKKK